MKFRLTLACLVLLLAVYWIIAHSYLIVRTSMAIGGIVCVVVILALFSFGGRKA